MGSSQKIREELALDYSKTAATLLIAALFGAICATYNVFYANFDLSSKFLYLHIFVSGSLVLFTVITAAVINRPFAWVLPATLLVFLNFNYAIQSEATLYIGQRVSIKFLIDNWKFVSDALTRLEILGLAAAFLSLCGLTYVTLNFTVKRMGRYPLIALPLFLVLVSCVLTFVHRERAFLFSQWEPTLALAGFKSKNFYFGNNAHLAVKESEFAKSYGPTESAKAKNVVVFMGESMNPDFLGQFGYKRNTVPFISDVQADFTFNSLSVGRATCAESICGLMSFLASRPLSEFPSVEALTITEVLRRNGYQINLILASDHQNFLNGFYGDFIEKQADFLFDFSDSSHLINSDEIIIEGLRELPPNPSGPTFTFVFFFSSHVLGEVPGPEGEFGKFKDLPRDKNTLNDKKEYSASEKEEYAVSYSNRLRLVSQYMSEAYAILKQRGYLDNADFFLLGDHGEEVAERGRLTHGHLTEGGLRIPFLWASDEAIPQIDERIFTQLDFAPTLSDRLNIETPSVWRGTSLFAPQRSQFVFHENGRYKFVLGMDCRAVFGPIFDSESAKFVDCVSNRGDQSNEFFDLSADYFERNNLWHSLDNSQRLTLHQMLE